MSHPPTPAILIVEDDEGHAILIRENLEAAGLTNRIQHFCDGQAVLDFFASDLPHAKENYIVLLDIRMPKVDGIEVLRRIKTDADLKTIPVIMLTTTEDIREVQRCHQIGCSGYIQKPVDYDKFAEAIRRIGLFVPLLLVPEVGGR
jgi:CheY-like chemotaxis protein